MKKISRILLSFIVTISVHFVYPDIFKEKKEIIYHVELFLICILPNGPGINRIFLYLFVSGVLIVIRFLTAVSCS